jgi:lysophospholipid acyltransferase (LPLAT)-like uncharacterized protein
MLARSLNHPAAQRMAAILLASYLRFALRTTRWTVEGAPYIAACVPNRAVIVAFWHECLPLMPALWMQVRAQNPAREGRVLISRHRDGRFIAAIMHRFHIGIVDGSSAKAGKAHDKGGASALRALLGGLSAGAAVVITPDGPRGPPRIAAEGVSRLAALGGVAVVPVAARLRWCIRLNTWDRMILPLPCGRGVLVCNPPITVARHETAAGHAAITASLTAAALRAEALCT